jgi:hypothetical protein
MQEVIEINWDEFEEQYLPEQNHLDDNASLDGTLLETYGDELAYVKTVYKTNPERVWTCVDDGDNSVLINGFHYVNRLGYIITKKPAEPNKYISVV